MFVAKHIVCSVFRSVNMGLVIKIKPFSEQHVSGGFHLFGRIQFFKYASVFSECVDIVFVSLCYF